MASTNPSLLFFPGRRRFNEDSPGFFFSSAFHFPEGGGLVLGGGLGGFGGGRGLGGLVWGGGVGGGVFVGGGGVGGGGFVWGETKKKKKNKNKIFLWIFPPHLFEGRESFFDADGLESKRSSPFSSSQLDKFSLSFFSGKCRTLTSLPKPVVPPPHCKVSYELLGLFLCCWWLDPPNSRRQPVLACPPFFSETFFSISTTGSRVFPLSSLAIVPVRQ